MRAFTGIVGAIVEAWSELRVNRTRVMLSLIGVAVAVAAITAVVAIGGVLEQAQTENSERYGGRPALLSVQVSDNNGASPDSGTLDAATARLAERYGIRYHSRVLQNQQLDITTPRGVLSSNLLAVDADYPTMHRLRVTSGRMPNQADETHLAPSVVIDANTWQLLGSPPLSGHPTLTLAGEQPVTAVVVGVQRAECDQCYSITMLYDQFDRLGAPAAALGNPPSWEAWVPPANQEALKERLTTDLSAEIGAGWNVNVNRTDYQAQGFGDPLLFFKLGVGGIAGLVLLLGALGLLNISLVTVRYRIREIGIRRSFGATAGRVFFSVMMESIVATVVAGFIGVLLAIVALQNPLSVSLIGKIVQDVPPFPISAAILGLVVSTVVGALAGLMPAIVAVRVKPIDAIRY